jgi:hypothetical protein
LSKPLLQRCLSSLTTPPHLANREMSIGDTAEYTKKFTDQDVKGFAYIVGV